MSPMNLSWPKFCLGQTFTKFKMGPCPKLDPSFETRVLGLYGHSGIDFHIYNLICRFFFFRL